MNADKRRWVRVDLVFRSRFIRVNLRLSAVNKLIVAVIGLQALACVAAEQRPPNIVVILADDFGVGDIHALYPSNKLATPNLDQLVSEGMHFTDAHAGSALCTPSRYGLLTGRYAWRTRLQHWVLAAYEPPLIDEQRLTLPAFLKQHGYQTACLGKWHLGWNWPGPQPSRMDENTKRAHEVGMGLFEADSRRTDGARVRYLLWRRFAELPAADLYRERSCLGTSNHAIPTRSEEGQAGGRG